MNKVPTKYVPADKNKVPFEKVDNPEVGYYYHLSWAYSGAKFALTKILDNGKGEVYCGKTSKKYMIINLSDLRKMR